MTAIGTTTQHLIDRLAGGDGKPAALVVEPYPAQPDKWTPRAEQTVLVEHTGHAWPPATDAAPRRIESIDYAMHLVVRGKQRAGEMDSAEMSALLDYVAARLDGWRGEEYDWLCVRADQRGYMEQDAVWIYELRATGHSRRRLALP